MRSLFLALLLLALPALASADNTVVPALGELPPLGAPLVTAVSVKPPPGEEAAELEALVTVPIGEPLSRRAVRRTVQRLFETGRFANVTAEAKSTGPGHVEVVFVCEPKRAIASVRIAGVLHLPEDDVLRASALREGLEFSEDRLDAAVAGIRGAYARVGYEQARVEVQTAAAGDGVAIVVTVNEGVPTRVAELRIVGDPGDPAMVRNAVAFAPGDVLDLARLDAALDALRNEYRIAGHYRSRVGSPRISNLLPGLAVIELEVQAGRKIDFAFRGNRIFDEPRLRTLLAYEGEENLDKAMVRDLAGRIERAYRRAGFHDARVFATEKRSKDGKSARITFHVEEGRSLYVKSVAFEGNRAVETDELEELVEQALLAAYGQEPLLQALRDGELDAALGRSRRSGGASFDPLRVYDEELYAGVTEALVVHYQEQGYLDVFIEQPAVEIDETLRVAQVRFRIDEGRQTRIRAVELVGSQQKDILSTSNVSEGEPLSVRAVEEARFKLRSALARRGYLYAQVKPEIVRTSPTAATVKFHVEEGPPVQVGRILVQGNTRTDPAVVEEALLFREGDVLGSEELASSQQRLMRLGLFRTVALRPIDPDVPEPVKDIVVDLRERPSRSLEIGGGVSIADGPRAFTEFTQRNLFGRNLEFGLRGRVNYQAFREDVLEMPLDEGIERYVDAGLRYPKIYGLPVEMGWRLDLIHERDIRPAYFLTKYSALTGVDWPISEKLQAGLLFELERNSIDSSPRIDELYAELSRQDLERLRFDDGLTLLGSIRPSLALDLRDDPVAPHAGLWARVEGDWANSLPGQSPVHFFKLSGTVTGYVPLATRTTLALSVGGGRVFSLDEASKTIAPKLFFLGGAGSIRGFSEDGMVPEDQREILRQQIRDCEALVYPSGCTKAARFLQAGRDVPSSGGETFALARAELRFPIRGELMGGLFLDAGNLWADPRNFDPLDLRPSAGAGVRYGTPVGPVALDLGMNLEPDEELNEGTFALHFSIGLF